MENYDNLRIVVLKALILQQPILLFFYYFFSLSFFFKSSDNEENGKFFPDDYFLEGLGILNLFENTIAINFNHRWLGTISFIYIFSLFLILTFKQSTDKHKIYFFIVLLILSIQFFLGIITLLSNVKISFASMHQTNSIILFAFLLLCYHKIKINQE